MGAIIADGSDSDVLVESTTAKKVFKKFIRRSTSPKPTTPETDSMPIQTHWSLILCVRRMLKGRERKQCWEVYLIQATPGALCSNKLIKVEQLKYSMDGASTTSSYKKDFFQMKPVELSLSKRNNIMHQVDTVNKKALNDVILGINFLSMLGLYSSTMSRRWSNARIEFTS